MPKIDLTGKKYEYYEVINKNIKKSKANGKNTYWDCRCQCGNIFSATTTDINRQRIKSCGCMRKELISKAHLQDITGQVFGELTVIGRDFNHEQHGSKPRTYWLCQCSCGNIVSVERTHLVNRAQKSCGCQQSIGELNIHNLLSENLINYKSQYTNSKLKTEKNGYLKFDFAILDNENNVIRLIEFDGPQHTQTFDYFGQFEDIKLRDSKKNEYAKNNNIPLVRIPYYKRDNLTLKDLMGDQFLI